MPTTETTLKAVDEMPTVCHHGESTERRCDICFATVARTYQVKYNDTSHIVILSIFTPVGSGTIAQFDTKLDRKALPQRLAQLEAADYTWTFTAWIEQLDFQFQLHGSEMRAGAFNPEVVNWEALYLDHSSPLMAYRSVA